MSAKQELYDNCIDALKGKNYALGFEFIRHIYSEDKSEGREMARRFRISMKSVMNRGGEESGDVWELIRKSYVMSARDYFDDFMVALEYYRNPKEQYWTPRRDKLLSVCEAMQDLEDGKLDELFLSLPPRTGKTTLVMFFMVWVMCRNMEGTNIYCTYSKDVADVFFAGIIEVFGDEVTYVLDEIFPECKVSSTHADRGAINIGRKKRYANILTRSITAGLNGLGDADSYIVVDDIHSGILEARNPQLLLSTWQTVNNNLLSRRKDGTKFLWIGTRWSVYDAISQRIDLLDTSDELDGRRYKIVNVPALSEGGSSNFDYPFGLGFSTKTFGEIRAAFEKSDDLASWYAQYMGQPIERNGQIFDPEALRYYNGELPDEEPDRVLMVVDPSWGGGDYVSAPVFFVYGEDLFLHDIVFSNKDKYVTEPLIVECGMRNGVQAMYVEGTRVTGTYADELDKRFKDAQYHVNLQKTTKHWASQSGKAQRIYDKAPEIVRKVVFRAPKNRDKPYHMAMEQLFRFTAEGKVKHDDFPDTLAMAMVVLQGNVRAKARAIRRFI